ncbi:DarT ssDNA thymidine ADP-ribosyltransferase family protein [Agromyces archimandritae]|uniref:DUF4433 domain-containing protein n=1 Tax=Agromyces archimandritae TaxID=2781962 RepID=A0A975FNT9_9MICO|nr:DarT ssDNA thymidine ADP-ribosyltransferase family protein [Agromyces archimandritae]QTX05294.1 DUF4433 domain-containing protein [Agromyces archimandritae]
MGDECIHGFDDGLCAVCNPPKPPEPAPAASAPARIPGTSAARTAAAASRAAAPAASRSRRKAAPSLRPEDDKPFDARAQRIFHLTHLDNLARILGSGAILSDAAGASPAVDIAAPAAREFRRATELGDTGAKLAEFVPFALSTDAHYWEAIRTGEPDPRLAPGAVKRRASEYVMLVSSIGQALGAGGEESDAVVLADRDPSIPGARTSEEWHELEWTLRRLAREGEESRQGAAEVLVRGSLPLERVALIAVSDEKVRDRVRQALSAIGVKTRVTVYPPWFQAGGGR